MRLPSCYRMPLLSTSSKPKECENSLEAEHLPDIEMSTNLMDFSVAEAAPSHGCVSQTFSWSWLECSTGLGLSSKMTCINPSSQRTQTKVTGNGFRRYAGTSSKRCQVLSRENGTLERILEIPRRHFVATTKQNTARGCRKSYFSFDSGALAKDYRCNTPQTLAATLKKLYLKVNQETLVTWGELRGIMAPLRRLYDIFKLFRASKTKRGHWTLLDNIRALSDEAESITQQLTSGPLHLGRTVVHDNGRQIPFTEKPRPKATPDGAK